MILRHIHFKGIENFYNYGFLKPSGKHNQVASEFKISLSKEDNFYKK